jgi:large subunit ribosomal protein L18
MITQDRRASRDIRKVRIRRRVRGSAARPRLAVFRSLNHIYAQLVDDDTARTVAAADSRSQAFRTEHRTGGNVAAAKAVGSLLAERARARGVERVVFDRGGYEYHGRVKALADAARAGGLVF